MKHLGLVGALMALSLTAACSSTAAGHPTEPDSSTYVNRNAAAKSNAARWDVCRMLGGVVDGSDYTEDAEIQPAAECDETLKASNVVVSGTFFVQVNNTAFEGDLGAPHMVDGATVRKRPLLGAPADQCYLVVGSQTLNITIDAISVSNAIEHLDPCQIANEVVPAAAAIVTGKTAPELRELPTRSVTELRICQALATTTLHHVTPFGDDTIHTYQFGTRCEIESADMDAELWISFGSIPAGGTIQTVGRHQLSVNNYTGNPYCIDYSAQQQLPSSPDSELLALQVSWPDRGTVPSICTALPNDLAELLTTLGLK